MKINNLLEATGPVIAFCWGRFQPPHLGHAQVFKKVSSIGKDGYYICTSQSQDPKKNPLDYATKVALLKEMFPQYADHILYDPKVKTIYDALTSIYNKMDPKVAEQTTLVFVGDPERIGDFQEGFRKYNGQQMRNGYYKFKDVTTFPNTDAADIRATDVRGAASSGDFNKFMQLTGTKGALAKKVYDAVRAGMGVGNKKLKEDIGYNFYELIKGPALLNLYDKMHHAKIKNKDMLKYVLDNIWYMKKLDPKTLRSIRQKFYQDPFGRNLHIDQKQIKHYVDLMKHYQNIDPVVIGPSGSIIDGNHRVRAAAELGQPIVAYVAVNENVAEKDLDVPTPTVQDLAKKYRTTVKQVNIELAKGIKVEMEHTTDVEVAREIALDHLNEKLDYYTELAKVEVSEQQQLNEFIWPALAAAVRIGAPAIMRLLGLGATTAAKVAVKNPKKTAAAAAAAANPSATMDVLNTTAKVYNVVKDPQAAIAALAKDHWGDVGEAVVDIAAIVGSQLTTDTVKALATFAVKNALPIAGVVALLYGGKKLYDYITAEEPAAVAQKKTAIAEAWSKKYKKSINCNNPKGFSQRARRAGKKTKSGSVSEEVINELAKVEKDISEVAKVRLSKDPNDLGAYVDDVGPDEPTQMINIKQIKYVFEPDDLHQTKSGAPERIEKMVQAIKNGAKLPPVLVRKFKDGYQVLDGHHRVKAYKAANIQQIPVRVIDPKNITGDIDELATESIAEAWSKKYKKSINCNNPKGFSQRAHCAGRKARRAGKKTKSSSVSEAVINELANEPYRYMLWKRTMMGNSYLFQTDGGQEIVVSMVPETLADGTHRVEVMFADKATFGLEKTGKGDAFRIFATVAQILKDYIKEAKFEVGEIYFTGKTKEPSRIKLYDKIARRLGQHIPGFEFYGAGDNSVEKGYIFKKTGGEQVKEEVIDEVSMSPGSLKKFAATDFAKSMTVGFEAEMAIEDMEEDEPDYGDSEPDFDMDEVVSLDRNWRQQVIRFFTGGDSNNTRREINPVLEQIDEEYYEWLSEQYQEWLDSDESRDTVIRFLKDYDSDISDEDIEDTVKNKNNNYWGSIEDDVREDWEGDNMNDESFQEFMEYREYDTMRGIFDKFSREITWPYYTEPEYSGGNVSYEDIESDFVEKTGYTATVSRGYHSAARKPGVWIFEPDSSISPAGVELVSPPMPLDEGLKALDDFFDWAKGYGAEANESTGFHMGVSIPEQTMDNVDHLKLILFLGDEYVLKQFGRESNSYTRSSLDKIRGQLKSRTNDLQTMLDNFKKGLNSEAAKTTGRLMIPKGDRYVSVNIKSNYIEFRSAGGNYFEKIPEIKNTMLRYVRAMAIAADPEAEKNEYAKKLYKLMATAFPDDIDSIKYFSGYAAGTITRSELKAMVNYARSERQRKAAPAKPKTYEIYLIGANHVFHTFTARDDEEANDIATDWARQNNKTDWDVRLANPRPLPAAPAQPTYRNRFAATIRNADGTRRNIYFTANDYASAREHYNELVRTYPNLNFVDFGYDMRPDHAVQQQSTETEPEWEIYQRSSNLPIHRFRAPNFSTAWQRGGEWARENGWGDRLEQISVREINASPSAPVPGSTMDRAQQRAAAADPTLTTYSAKYRDQDGVERSIGITASNYSQAQEQYMNLRRAYPHISFIGLQTNSGQTNESLGEMLKKVKGKWALVSRHNPKKVLQYYHGSGHPSKEWVNKVERRVQAFKHMEEAEEMKPAIFIDMDGTIADFFGEWAKLDGKDHYKDIEHKEDALDLVREHPTFWVDLPLLPNARELVKAAIDLYGEYYICSKPLEHDPKSAPGKLAWIQKHFGDMPPKDVFFTDNKGAYAQMGGRPNILVDDFGKYVDGWKAAGGIAIKYRPERFPEVLELLRKLAK